MKPCKQTQAEKEGRGKKKMEKKSSHLYEAADDLGKHVERKPEDVKERERHKGLLRIQDVVLIHSHIHGKRRQGNLGTHQQTGRLDISLLYSSQWCDATHTHAHH